jgi:chromosome segregation ATPase
MPEDVKKDSYSFEEHTAILADRVARETSEVTAKNTELEAKVQDLTTKLDAADSAKLAAEQAKEKAEGDLTTYKADVEKREAAAERAGTRTEVIKTKLPHLDDKWFEAEGRMDRIVAMEDDKFEGYVDDLLASAPAGDGKTPITREVPRETAMVGKTVEGGAVKGGAASAFLLRDYAPQEA